MTNESFTPDEPPVLLKDEDGRTLTCSVEQTFDLQNDRYLLLLPIDAPIEIFLWQEEDEDEAVILDIEDDEVEALFPTARAVLAEQNLALKNTAITLTASGELPEAEEEDCFSLEVDDVNDGEEAATEEFQILATFFHEDEEYIVCTPLNPLLIFAKRDEKGDLAVVSPEEFQKIRNSLEEKLFDMLD